MRIENEFASVDIVIHRLVNGALMEISDPRSRKRILLDPLELEALTRLTMEERRAHVDPSVRSRAVYVLDDINDGLVGW
jgi:hypothetical protein